MSTWSPRFGEKKRKTQLSFSRTLAYSMPTSSFDFESEVVDYVRTVRSEYSLISADYDFTCVIISILGLRALRSSDRSNIE